MSTEPLPSSFDSKKFYEESRWQKFTRRLKEEPLVPLGLGATCYALLRAYKSMRTGDRESTNRFFRMRIYAQGFTLVAILLGSYYFKEERQQRELFEGVLAEKKAQTKRDAWIKELEARDLEDKMLKAKKAAYFENMEAEAKRRAGEAKSMLEEGDRPRSRILEALGYVIKSRR